MPAHTPSNTEGNQSATSATSEIDVADSTALHAEPQTPDTESTAEQPFEEATFGDAVTTGNSTAPLPELSAPSVALLSEGSIVGDRYQVVSLLGAGVGQDSHVYDVVDQQGHLRCWACGSSSSEAGDMYCVECGAQLAGRHYRLQELHVGTNQGDATASIPEAILENKVPGVSHIYDTYSSEAGPTYVVWEEAYGRTLDSWLPTSDAVSSTQDEVTEEQAVLWTSQAAQVLAHLHAEGIAGCEIKAKNLLVQPGDRLLLIEPAGCRALQGSTAEQAEVQAEDVRRLGGELEQWYLAVRSYSGASQAMPSTPASDSPSAPEETQLIAEADENTGSLETVQNQNLALVLARARDGAYPTADAFAQALLHLREASAPQPYLQLWSGRASDVGQVRAINEDSVLTLEAAVLEQDGHLPIGLYVIADGMGGHESGEVASSIAVRTIGSIVNSALIAPMVAGETVARDANTCGGLLRQAVIEANRRIANLAQDRHSDLGTTVVAALVIGGQVSVVNVGDSRAYTWHGGQLATLTRDHSLVAQLVAAGQISPDDIYTHPRRNEIFRALGDQRLTEGEVDVFSHQLQPGDGLLLCSDGLWDFVRDPSIAATLVEHQTADPQSACHTLIEQANTAGGEDNISVVFVRLMLDA